MANYHYSNNSLNYKFILVFIILMEYKHLYSSLYKYGILFK